MAQVIIQRAPAAPDVYCYDKPTNAAEVNTTLHEIVSKYRETRSIYVISGTHGCADGTVVPNCKEPDFKYEDLNSANKTSRLIHIRDYHQTAPNRWAEREGLFVRYGISPEHLVNHYKSLSTMSFVKLLLFCHSA